VYVNVPLVTSSALGAGWYDRVTTLCQKLLRQSFDEDRKMRAERRSLENGEYGSGEDEDEDEGEEGDDKVAVPLLVVGVAGIPRNGLVEVEFLGCPYPERTEAASVSARLSTSASASASSSFRRLDSDIWAGVCCIPSAVATPAASTAEALAARTALVVEHAIMDAVGIVVAVEMCTLRVYYDASSGTAPVSVGAVQLLQSDSRLAAWCTVLPIPVMSLAPGTALSVHVTVMVR
jgi:hypothetical protein